jgi:hypothetical protein
MKTDLYFFLDVINGSASSEVEMITQILPKGLIALRSSWW